MECGECSITTLASFGIRLRVLGAIEFASGIYAAVALDGLLCIAIFLSNLVRFFPDLFRLDQ